MVTVVLLNYKRPDNLRRIINAVKSQSVATAVFVWNNGERFEDRRVDWQIDSSINLYCRPRWFMSRHADTEFVCTLDDDLVFADDRVLQDALDALRALPVRTIVGMTGVVLRAESNYRDCTHLDRLPRFPEGDVEVDIVKGRFMLLRAAAVTALDYPAIDPVHDDIALSALVGGGARHRVPGILRGRFTELPQLGVGLSHRPRWLVERERSRRRYFR